MTSFAGIVNNLGLILNDLAIPARNFVELFAPMRNRVMFIGL